MESVAITDHGTLYGVIQFYRQVREVGIKPIVGCEVYVAPQGLKTKNPRAKKLYHLVLLAKNEKGYRNLLQLVTTAHLEGFYYKPRVDRKLLAKHSEGLIALSGCLQGEVSQLILEGNLESVRKSALWHKETFEDFYLELQKHNIPELSQVNKGLISLSQELGIPLVATNDVHYLNKEDARFQEILLCIQTNSTLSDEKRMKMPDDSFYFKTPAEMEELFSEIPEALKNTERIAEKCNLNLEFGRLHLPEMELLPEETPDSYLKKLCYKGINSRYQEITPEIKSRLDYELDVIEKTEFANYFFVVWDVVSYVRKNGIFFGVRGSAAASLVLYALGVTDIDPLAHNLVFERFLNLERREMPDIDLDFEDDRRDEVISYVAQKYGSDRVAQIITFGTLGARAAIRDVGRVLGMPYSFVDRVAKLVPFTTNTIQRALEESPELRNIYRQDKSAKDLIDTAQGVEGIARHASTHAAGVVISKEPLTQVVSLQRPSKGKSQSLAMTQFAMEDIARVGLLKMDFLGLANLTILRKAREFISQTQNIELDLDKISLDDPKTYKLLSSGETVGVFQLEGAGMRRYLKDLKPSSFSDLSAMVALYRPGPKQHIPTFIKSKHGKIPIRYPHPALAQILEETYGIIVYQDQVLKIVQTFASYTLGQADIVRKAMGKKIPEIMRKEKKGFIEGAKEKGFSEKLAEEVWNLIEPFAGYAFNKAHSVSYTMLAYKTAYLKANYQVEFMTAILATNIDNLDKIASNVAECSLMGISVLPPDVNKSEENFTIEKDGNGSSAIRFGLGAIKNVGVAAIKPLLVACQERGSFKSIEDLCQRVDLREMGKRALESLIKAGALDSLGKRETLLAGINRILAFSQQEQRSQKSGQITMFNFLGENAKVSLDLPENPISSQKKSAWEKELLGVCFSDNKDDHSSKCLIITLTENDDDDGAALLEQVVETLKEFPGESKVRINVAMNGEVEKLEMPHKVVQCDELHQRLASLVGEKMVKVKAERIRS
jgi:DNA polymerase-3 subunit alpha